MNLSVQLPGLSQLAGQVVKGKGVRLDWLLGMLCHLQTHVHNAVLFAKRVAMRKMYRRCSSEICENRWALNLLSVSLFCFLAIKAVHAEPLTMV